MAMYESLRRFCPQFKLWVLCLDPATHRHLKSINRSDLEPISLEEFERDDQPLIESRNNRSLIEYYFTCTPSLPLFIFKRDPAVEQVTYLDADLLFFSPLDPLFEEIAGHSIAIIPHRFPASFRKAERHGIFNVGWVTFRRDNNGLACLERWRTQCIDRCVDSRDGDVQFADQQYLDDWPAQFQNLIVLGHRGANLAPWNIANYEITLRGKDIFVDEDPLIFFHFHGLRRLNRYVYDTCFQHYGGKLSPVVVRNIYEPYLRRIGILPNNGASSYSPPLPRENTNGGSNSPAVRAFDLINHLLKRHYLLVLGGRVF